MTTRQKALAAIAQRGLSYEDRPSTFAQGGHSAREIELLPPEGFLFDDGGDGLTGLVCDGWKNVLERIEAGEAELIPE